MSAILLFTCLKQKKTIEAMSSTKKQVSQSSATTKKFAPAVNSSHLILQKAFVTCLDQKLTWDQLQILKARKGWETRVIDYVEGVVEHCIKPKNWSCASLKKVSFDQDPEKGRVWAFNPIAVAVGLETLKLRKGWEPRCERFYGRDVIQWHCRKLEPAVTGLSIEVETGGVVDHWFTRLLHNSLKEMTKKENEQIKRMGPDWKEQVEYYRAAYAGDMEKAQEILKRMKRLS